MIAIDAVARASVDVPLIALERVSKRYSVHGLAVREVNLTIDKGAFVCVVGDSGSGKTTLLKMINRLIEPDSGTVRVAGTSVRSVPASDLRRRIGYVFQQVGLFPHMTVAENIGITPRLLRWPDGQITARVLELLQLVGLPETFRARMPSQLSGGQRQRIGVARALAARPAIMIMDEPFGALDPINRDMLGTEYLRMHKELGLTTVMVTHDIMEAVLLSDRIVVMRAGEIVADGTPHELLTGTRDPGVQRLMDTPRQQVRRIAQLISENGTGG